MALDTGKRKVLKKTIDTQVPYVPAKSYASIAFDSLKPTIDRIQADQEKTAQANYFYDFSIKTNEFFKQAKLDNQFDADAMKASVETYSKTLLEQTPPKYKIQAAAMLAQHSMDNINYAATEKYKLDLSNKAANREINWNNFNTQTEFAMNTFTDNELDVGLTGINARFFNALKTTNELGKNDLENHVNTGDITLKAHDLNLREQTKAIAIARGFNIMKLMYKNGMDVEAINWLSSLKNGIDKTPFPMDEDMKNNPVYKMYDYLMKDDDDREDIINKIYSKFKDFHHETLYGKTEKPNVNLAQYYEPNQLLSKEMFKGGGKNGHDIAMSINGIEEGDSNYKEIITYVNKMNAIQGKIAHAMQTQEIINFKDDDEKTLFAETVLANHGVHTIQMGMDVNGNFTDSFMKAARLLKTQNIFAPQWKEYLKITDGVSYTNNEPMINDIKEKLATYKFLTSEAMFPHWNEASDTLKWAAENGVLESDNVRAAQILDSYASIDWDKRYNQIVSSYRDGVDNVDILWGLINLDLWGSDRLDNQITKSIRSPHAFLKLFSNQSDPYHKILFSQANQTTWLQWDPAKIMPKDAKNAIESMFLSEMTLISSGDNFDIWSKENKHLRKKAWLRTMERLKNEDWGVEVNTLDGVPRFVKKPFWKEYGTLHNQDVYRAFYTDFHEMDAEEQLSMFGTNKFDEAVDTYLKPWFDNRHRGDVRIATEATTYNYKGNTGYKLVISKGAEEIELAQNFVPSHWDNILDKDAPSSSEQLVNHTANEVYQEFEKTELYQFLDQTDQEWAKRFIYGYIRNGLKIADTRVYPDWPLFNDVPAEIRPFKWLAHTFGFKGDLRQLAADAQLMNSIATKNIDFNKKIQMNTKLDDGEKVNNSLIPIEQMPYSENNLELHFKHQATENYANESLPLTYRTNNWTAITSSGWDNEIDLNYYRGKRKFAVFSHPKHSIRAAVKTILNHSLLTEKINGEKIPTIYGAEPTIQEILEGLPYAENLTSYYESLDAHTDFEKTDKIDLLNANQVHKFIKFIVRHEMGVKYFDNKFKNDEYVNAIIYRGIRDAINSYNGALGKL